MLCLVWNISLMSVTSATVQHVKLDSCAFSYRAAHRSTVMTESGLCMHWLQCVARPESCAVIYLMYACSYSPPHTPNKLGGVMLGCCMAWRAVQWSLLTCMHARVCEESGRDCGYCPCSKACSSIPALCFGLLCLWVFAPSGFSVNCIARGASGTPF